MESIDWCDIISMMKFLITSCNNFNPYVHPMYYSVRNNIKYNLDSDSFGEYESLFRDTDIQASPIDVHHIFTNKACNKGARLVENYVPLYDSKSFCCNRPYIMKDAYGDDMYVFKNDFIKNIVKLSYDPVGFVEVNKNIFKRNVTPPLEDQNTQDDQTDDLNYLDSETAKDLLKYMVLKNKYTGGRGIII